jgi:Flp pilus assembly protein TadB
MRPSPASKGLAIAAVAAFLTFLGLTVQEDAAQKAAATRAQRHRQIQANLLHVGPDSDKQRELSDEERRQDSEDDSWRAKSGARSLQRWILLALTTFGLCPVIVYGYHVWSAWDNDRRTDPARRDT